MLKNDDNREVINNEEDQTTNEEVVNEDEEVRLLADLTLQHEQDRHDTLQDDAETI